MVIKFSKISENVIYGNRYIWWSTAVCSLSPMSFRSSMELQNNNNNYAHKYLVVGFESTKIIFKALNKLIELFDSIIITETKIRDSIR